MKMKSLTLQIWLIFTSVLIAVILGITVLYYFTVVKVDEANRFNDLTVVHQLILNNPSEKHDPSMFRGMNNLRESVHMLISDGEISVIGMTAPRPPRMYAKMNEHFLSFANGHPSSKRINTKFDGIDLIAVISSTDNCDYLVSYMPYFYNTVILNYLLVIGLIFLAAGFLISRIIASYIARPLSKLEKFTERIAAKKWGEPINTGRHDEIGRLAESMNKMQDALRRADCEEQTFLQSISHDLKTPVMVIMSHADAIIDGVYIDTPENTAKIIKDEAINLSKKLKKLLYFNTLSYSLDNYSESEPLYLDKTVLGIIERMTPLKPSVFREPELEATEIFADREKITVAIENVLDNAIRYAQTEITVTLKNRTLEIYNDGKNIPEEHIENIFNNMYKDKTGNFGLGLAISKKIITYYGGSIKAENRPDGVCFIIQFQ
ncbi:MAG: HAMP domain-containing histidine kinase [Clostridia bacterium]|nr:HAMP domain-containing histidine kinase [Clostridia bacterium]